MKYKNSLSLMAIVLFALLFMSEAVLAKSYRIRSSDNINKLVDRFYPKRQLSKAQIMVGLLARNPRAFKDGNINFLMKGRRIQLPKESEMSAVSHLDAKKLLSKHTAFFRKGQTGKGELSTTSSSHSLTEKSKPAVVQIRREEQQLKIRKLENESKALKMQVERLLKAKKERDIKLLALEKSINDSLQQDKKKVTQMPH